MSTGFSNLRRAEARASQIENSIREGVYELKKQKLPTLQEFWETTYKPVYSAGKAHPERDEQMMAPMLHVLGNLRLNQIKKSQCEWYLRIRRHDSYVPGGSNAKTEAAKARRVTISEGTVSREHGLFQAVFEAAIQDFPESGLRNPWKLIKRTPYKARTNVLELEDQPSLLEACVAKMQRWTVVMLSGGCRLDELRTVDHETDINWRRRLIRVVGKGNKERHVPIRPEAEAALKEQIRLEGRLWPHNPQYFRDYLARACKRAGIPHLSPHTLRHTFATRWLQDGGDIYTLSKILGHSSVSVTERHYAHLLQEDLVKASDRVSLGLEDAGKAGATKVTTFKSKRRNAQ